jgi:hypothetical protein
MKLKPAVQSRADETRPHHGATAPTTHVEVESNYVTPDRTLRATSNSIPNLPRSLDGGAVPVQRHVCPKDAGHIHFYRRDGVWTCGVCYPQPTPPRVI